MKENKKIFGGIFMAILTSLIILGGALLSLTESPKKEESQRVPTELVQEDEIPTLIFILPQVSSLTAETALTATATPTPSLTPMANCPIPSGWITVILETDETTESIAQHYGVSVQELAAANCWDYAPSKLLAGTSLYVPVSDQNLTLTPGIWCRPQGEQSCVPMYPPTLSPTYTPTSICKPRSDWYVYIVRPGDTLYSISQATGVSVYAIQRGNCMGNTTAIHAGQTLLVPILPPPPLPPTSTPRAPTPNNKTPSPTFWIITQPLPPPITPQPPPVISPTIISTFPQHPPPVTQVITIVPPPVATNPVSTLPSHLPTATSIIPVLLSSIPPAPVPITYGPGSSSNRPV